MLGSISTSQLQSIDATCAIQQLGQAVNCISYDREVPTCCGPRSLAAVASSMARGPACCRNLASSAACITPSLADSQSGRTSCGALRCAPRPSRAASSGLAAAWIACGGNARQMKAQSLKEIAGHIILNKVAQPLTKCMLQDS